MKYSNYVADKTRKVFFPLNITVKGNHYIFNNVKELYDFYYNVKASFITEFSRPFWRQNIDLTELVHFPENFTIITK